MVNMKINILNAQQNNDDNSDNGIEQEERVETKIELV